jgi:hypothetical protein
MTNGRPPQLASGSAGVIEAEPSREYWGEAASCPPDAGDGLPAAAPASPAYRTGYAVLRATHAAFLTVQLPGEVARLIGHDWVESRELRAPGREIAFLDRGPGFCRVVSVLRSADLLPKEIARNRFIGRARVGRKRLFYLPVAVANHLNLALEVAERSGKTSTLDSVVWLLDAATYYRHRSRTLDLRQEAEEGTPAPRIYIAKATMPIPPAVEQLEDHEERREPGRRLSILAGRMAL